MYTNRLRFSTMSVSVARKSRLQSSRTATHARIGTENDWQKCVIDCWCNKWAFNLHYKGSRGLELPSVRICLLYESIYCHSNDSRCEIHWVWCSLHRLLYRFSIEMLWYLVLTYWVGLDIIAIYEILWKKYKSKSNTICATMWENDSLRKIFHYHTRVSQK